LIPTEQTILTNWYNSLYEKGSLNWTTTNDLCGQDGVTCAPQNPTNPTGPQVLTQLFFFFFLFFFFLFSFF